MKRIGAFGLCSSLLMVAPITEPLPVKRTMKNNKIILRLAATVASRFLRCEIALVLLHRRQDAETALHTPRVVVVYVSFDHVD